MNELEKMALDFRAHVRAKAGLQVDKGGTMLTDWNATSDGMKAWYRELALKSSLKRE